MKKIAISTVCILAMLTMAFAAAGCAPKASESQGTPSNAAESSADGGMEFAWTVESDCAMCHAMEQGSLSDASLNIAKSHSNLSCMTCHDDEDGLVAAHANVDMDDTDGATKLRKTKISADACLACHEDDYAAANYTGPMMVDSEGTEVSPHDIPVNESHDMVTCSNCHGMHVSTQPYDAAVDRCTGCHHDNVFECYTCHD